jgi:hypothetical protein
MKSFIWFGVGVIFVLMLVTMCSCTFVDLRTGNVCQHHNLFQCTAGYTLQPETSSTGHTLPKAMSWDQENLKLHDRGCPTAIFVVNPETKLLEQCT